IDLRQSESRQRQAGRCARDRNFRFDVVPTPQQFAPEFSISARAHHLIEHELVIIFNRFDDLSELAHLVLRFAVLRRSETAATDLPETKSNNRSTPGSRWRFATASISC